PNIELLINPYTQCLKRSLGRVTTGPACRRWHCLAHCLNEITDAGKMSHTLSSNDSCCKTLRKLVIVVTSNELLERALVIAIDKGCSAETMRGVHTHVKRSIVGVGKSTFSFI